MDGSTRRHAALPLGSTIFVECKVSRGDFLRDTAERPRLLLARARLQREFDHICEEFVKPGEPELRDSGNFLFPDMEAWALDRARSPALRAVRRELRRLDAAIHGQTKFFMLAQYRLAERLYVLAAPGVVEAVAGAEGGGELPRGWGLLVAEPAREVSAPASAECPVSGAFTALREVVPAPELDSPAVRRLRVLRNIAATRE